MKKIISSILYLLTALAWNAEVTAMERTMPQPFSVIAKEYENALFDYMPELGLFWGKTDVALDRFADASLARQEQWWRQEDNFLAALREVNRAELSDSDSITYQLLTETLEAKQASRICREALWDVNPASGWHSKLAIVAEKQPVGTALYRQQALQRWQGFADVVDTQIANLKMGVTHGYTAPKPAVKRVLMQLNIILNNSIEESPFFDFARRDSDPTFKDDVYHLVQHSIHPALKKYKDYLEQTYLKVARDEIGLSALPSGAACYQAKILEETTLVRSPQDIHALGLQTMQTLTEEVAAIGTRLYATQNMASTFQQAKVASQNYFSTAQDVLDYNFAALARAKAKLPEWFGMQPETEGILKPYPEYRAKTGASGEYHPPNEAGTEPGVFYINAYDPPNRGRIDQEATLFHELIPGHHFQIALHYENKSLPPLTHYLFNSGFGEGWALYVERLADEMGLYDDEISRLGMLSNETLRSARLVVDTGIHSFGWSRQQAVDYLKQHTALSDAIIEGEVDRYIMLPGQATSYMLGKIEITQLRQLAKQQLGEDFDIREFHDQVLKNGTVTLPMLRRQIATWLETFPQHSEASVSDNNLLTSE